MMSAQGIKSNGTQPPEKAGAYSYSSFEKVHVKENRKRMIVGGPDQIHAITGRVQNR
jgi:hypothetical protein